MESEWTGELAELRNNLQPIQRMRVTWRWRQGQDWWRKSLWRAMTDPSREEAEFWVALYDPTADDGAVPVVEVRLDPRGPIEAIADGELVDVAGRVAPGGAVALVTLSGVCWPLYPATLSWRRPRLVRSPSRGTAEKQNEIRSLGQRLRLGIGMLTVAFAVRLVVGALIGGVTLSGLLATLAVYVALVACTVAVVLAYERFRGQR